MFSFPGTRPTNLGVHDGNRLADINKSKPNCVSSQTDPKDSTHYIDPIDCSAASAKDAKIIEHIHDIVEGLRLTKVLQSNEKYLYAEFATPLCGFVDDVEFLWDASAGVVHVRSASRLGYSDAGVNRKRIEIIRRKFGAL